jgi:hypothetical protein
MSGKLKQINPADYQKLCGGVVGIAPMTNVNNNGVSDDLVVDETTIWNQVEQRQLETAIVQFPKGTPERWEKISRLCGRTKVSMFIKVSRWALFDMQIFILPDNWLVFNLK